LRSLGFGISGLFRISSFGIRISEAVMAVKVYIPTPLRQHTQGQAPVEVIGGPGRAAPDHPSPPLSPPPAPPRSPPPIPSPPHPPVRGPPRPCTPGAPATRAAGGPPPPPPWPEADMADEAGAAVPEGAAVFPPIPEELGVDPLLLAVLHATVFLAGSGETV